MWVAAAFLTILFFFGGAVDFVRCQLNTTEPISLVENLAYTFSTPAGTFKETYLGEYNSKRYFLGEDSVSYHDATARCKGTGMDLVSFTAAVDYDFLAAKLALHSPIANPNECKENGTSQKPAQFWIRYQLGPSVSSLNTIFGAPSPFSISATSGPKVALTMTSSVGYYSFIPACASETLRYICMM